MILRRVLRETHAVNLSPWMHDSCALKPNRSPFRSFGRSPGNSRSALPFPLHYLHRSHSLHLDQCINAAEKSNILQIMLRSDGLTSTARPVSQQSSVETELLAELRIQAGNGSREFLSWRHFSWLIGKLKRRS